MSDQKPRNTLLDWWMLIAGILFSAAIGFTFIDWLSVEPNAEMVIEPSSITRTTWIALIVVLVISVPIWLMEKLREKR